MSSKKREREEELAEKVREQNAILQTAEKHVEVLLRENRRLAAQLRESQGDVMDLEQQNEALRERFLKLLMTNNAGWMGDDCDE